MVHPTVHQLHVYVWCVIFSFALALEKGSECVTPNNENATCIPINDCWPIKQAITYLEEEAIDFARQSQCGYEGTALVCCGTVGKITQIVKTTTTVRPQTLAPIPPSPAQPIDNSYLPDSSLCGLQVKQSRIVGGTQADISEFPWMVALKYTKNDGTPGGFRCSGTLINTRYILTAAQCLDIAGYNLTEVRLGEWRFSTSDDCVQDTDYLEVCADPILDLHIVEKIPHPFYSKRSGNNDIALLRVEKKIKYTEYVRPICLPPSEFPVPPIGTLMYISGWGDTENGSQSDVKLKVEIPMVGHEDCSKVYPNYTRIFINQACAGGEEGKGACTGDSGGPLMRTYVKQEELEEEQWFQEGIIYRNFGCGKKNSPSLYTRVSRFVSWILNNVRYT